jgi:hypothetical protein
LLDCESRGGGEEAGVAHFFDGFTDGEDEGTVREGEDNVSIKLVCRVSLLYLTGIIEAHHLPSASMSIQQSAHPAVDSPPKG